MDTPPQEKAECTSWEIHKVKKAWKPRLQHLYDQPLMELIASYKELKPEELRLANECRLRLWAILVSELVDVCGVGIPMEHLKGDWQKTPVKSLRWPNQPESSNVHCVSLCRYLQHTFCTETSLWQHSGLYMINEPLGPWFQVPRHMHYDCITEFVFEMEAPVTNVLQLLSPMFIKMSGPRKRKC